MDYRELGRSGVKVSSLCLGTMTFGEQNSEAEGHAQLDYAFDRGINIFDASEIYPVPPKPRPKAAPRRSSARGSPAQKRDQVMIATKIAGRGKMTWLRKAAIGDAAKCGPDHRGDRGEPQRLQTDYIDLYQLHWPDRPMRVFEGLDYLPSRRRHPSDSARSSACWRSWSPRQGQVRRPVQRDAVGVDELPQGLGAAWPAPTGVDPERV